MASKKTSKSRQSIKDLSPRERQAKSVKGGRELTTAARLPVDSTAALIARPPMREPGRVPSAPSRPARI
jgi:hypothetical protein